MRFFRDFILRHFVKCINIYFSEMQPSMLVRLLRKLTVDVSVLTEYTTVALRVCSLLILFQRAFRHTLTKTDIFTVVNITLRTMWEILWCAWRARYLRNCIRRRKTINNDSFHKHF